MVFCFMNFQLLPVSVVFFFFLLISFLLQLNFFLPITSSLFIFLSGLSSVKALFDFCKIWFYLIQISWMQNLKNIFGIEWNGYKQGFRNVSFFIFNCIWSSSHPFKKLFEWRWHLKLRSEEGKLYLRCKRNMQNFGSNANHAHKCVRDLHHFYLVGKITWWRDCNHCFIIF